MSEENLNLHEFTSHSKCVQLKCNKLPRPCQNFVLENGNMGTKTKCYLATYVFV